MGSANTYSAVSYRDGRAFDIDGLIALTLFNNISNLFSRR